MKASTNFQDGPDAPVNLGMTARGLGNARKNLKQGALTCPVAADDAHYFPLLHVKGNVVESPKGISSFESRVSRGRTMAVADCGAEAAEWSCGGGGNDIAQCFVTLLLADAVLLAQSFTANC